MTKKKAATKPRNRAAQDINLINLRALKRRVKALEDTAETDGRIISKLDQRLTALERKAGSDLDPVST